MKLVAAALAIALVLSGCDTAPVIGAAPDCEDDQPAVQTYLPWCPDGVSRRCTWEDGSTRFAGCQLGAIYCVEACKPPPCDTLTSVFFVSRCDAGHARCALKSTAPAGAVASGCELTIISQPSGRAELVECVEACE